MKEKIKKEFWEKLKKNIMWRDNSVIEKHITELVEEAIDKAREETKLKELLNTCGMGFRSLSLHSDGRWIAKSGHRALPTRKLFTGKTPEEALYKLLTALEKQLTKEKK